MIPIWRSAAFWNFFLLAKFIRDRKFACLVYINCIGSSLVSLRIHLIARKAALYAMKPRKTEKRSPWVKPKRKPGRKIQRLMNWNCSTKKCSMCLLSVTKALGLTKQLQSLMGHSCLHLLGYPAKPMPVLSLNSVAASRYLDHIPTRFLPLICSSVAFCYRFLLRWLRFRRTISYTRLLFHQ